MNVNPSVGIIVSLSPHSWQGEVLSMAGARFVLILLPLTINLYPIAVPKSNAAKKCFDFNLTKSIQPEP